MNNFQLTPEQILKLSPIELQNLADELKKTYNISNEIDLKTPLDKNIDSYRYICKKNWKKSISDMANYIVKGRTTLPSESMVLAGRIIGRYLKILVDNNRLDPNIKIIEPFAGNGVASKIIYDKIIEFIPTINYIASDIQDLNTIVDANCLNVEFNIDCVDSIDKHQENSQVLMLVSPPPYTYTYNGEEPCGFSDYFSIKRWEELGKKILIYIGEMGFTDGTSGMYDYMMNHNVWKLKFRKVLIEKNDLFGRLVKKEIFIFENSTIF